MKKGSKKGGFQKGASDFVKDIVALAVIVVLAFGAFKVFENYKTSNAHGDDSYKVETERNTKYNGVYSLTKLDENGKNTWNGLMLYVKNDKIISCARYIYTPMEEVKEKLIEKYGDKYKDKTLDEITDFYHSDDLVNKEFLEVSDTMDECRARGVVPILDTGFFRSYMLNNKLISIQGEFVCKDKVDFDRVTDIKTDYDFMKDCLIVPGYDEDSQEVWLSKLLTNEKSEYHKDYKLIRYTKYNDFKNCVLDMGGCLDELNKLFNAGL